MTPETTAQWQQLANAALQAGMLAIAERCYAAVGNIAKAHYLHQVRAHCYRQTHITWIHFVNAGCLAVPANLLLSQTSESRLCSITSAGAEKTLPAVLFAVKSCSLSALALDYA